MIKTLFLFLLSIVLFSCNASGQIKKKSEESQVQDQNAPEEQNKMNDEVKAFVNPFIQNHDFEGFVLVQHQGKIVVSESFSNGKSSFTAKTPFMIGSVTKTFTAEIINSLINKGDLELSTNLAGIIPEAPKAEQITIRHLLTHSSGIPDYYSIDEFSKFRNKKLSLKEFVKWISAYPLDFEPGTKNAYSNSGYNLLAHIIESSVDESFNKTLHSEVLSPLKMTSSGSIEAKVPQDLPVGYEPGNAPTFVRIPQKTDPSWLIGSGSIYSTAEDLLKWSAEILKRLKDDNGWKPYGWAVRKRNDIPYIQQNGRIPGFASMLQIYPEKQAVIIVLSRIESESVNNIAEGISDIVYGIEPKITEDRIIKQVNPNELSDYEGVYQITPSFFVTVSIDDGGLGVATGRGTQLNFAVLDPLGNDQFFFRVGHAKIKFARSKTGKVSGLYWGAGGPFPLVEE